MSFQPRRRRHPIFFFDEMIAALGGKGIQVPPPPPAKEVPPPPRYKDTEAGTKRHRPPGPNKPWWVTDERKDAEGPLTL
jgi:hypothetical protein